MRKNNHVAYLCLGSNLGDRSTYLFRAVAALVEGGLILTAMSSVYETEPVDYLDQPAFLNLVIAAEAPNITPFSLLEFCLSTEDLLGRERTIRRGARTIDIDLLFFDDVEIDAVQNDIALTLPHPRLHQRRFVLTPLAEIAPGLRHPTLGKTMAQLLADVTDSASVRIHV